MKLPRHAEIWLQPYLAERAGNLFGASRHIRHVWLTIADHYEPFWNGADLKTALRRVDTWRKRWPEIAAGFTTREVFAPRYTFFYPVEQYHPDILDALAEMTHAGIADVEVHLHHDGQGREDFRDSITRFCRLLADRHGLLRRVDGHIRFGFIHGNWALDNSLPDGRWCGLNDEITLLRDLGCYADFTMPSGASPSQTRIINKIYWCTDDPESPKSYDQGVPVRRGDTNRGDLLMIPGPFGLRWRQRMVPRMETGELAAYDCPTAYRVRRWFELAPRISEHVFIKVYTHGAQEGNMWALLSGGLHDLFTLTRQETDRRRATLHVVSAWQMYCAISALSRNSDPVAAVLNHAVTQEPAEVCPSN